MLWYNRKAELQSLIFYDSRMLLDVYLVEKLRDQGINIGI